MCYKSILNYPRQLTVTQTNPGNFKTLPNWVSILRTEQETKTRVRILVMPVCISSDVQQLSQALTSDLTVANSSMAKSWQGQGFSMKNSTSSFTLLEAMWPFFFFSFSDTLVHTPTSVWACKFQAFSQYVPAAPTQPCCAQSPHTHSLTRTGLAAWLIYCASWFAVSFVVGFGLQRYTFNQQRIYPQQWYWVWFLPQWFTFCIT